MTTWTRRDDPEPTQWVRAPMSFFGFILNDNGFEELVGGNLSSLTFQLDGDFCSLSAEAKVPGAGYAITEKASGFIEFLELP